MSTEYVKMQYLISEEKHLTIIIFIFKGRKLFLHTNEKNY